MIPKETLIEKIFRCIKRKLKNRNFNV